jgi:death on curing protein
VRDWGLLESAIGRPFTGYYRPIHRKAAALVESLTRNHGFADGNKRTAFLIIDLFLYRSGYRLESRLGNAYVELERFILRIVEDRLPFDDIAGWFKARVAKRR